MKSKTVTLIIIFVIILAIPIVFLLIQSSSEPTDDDLIIMHTGSMEPTIKEGDYLRIDRQITFEEIQLGDIIVYQRTSDVLAHRVIDKKVIDGREVLLMHGDANPPGSNEYVYTDRIVGKVIEIIPSSK